MRPGRLTIALLCSVMTCATSLAAEPPATGPAAETPEHRAQRLAWWKEARFGLFMHWGIYAIPANEWKGLEKKNNPVGLGAEWIMYNARIPVAEYEPLAKQFNPVKFNAGDWVDIARDAGMKYIVITAKHCDGFAMYASKASKYNIVDATPFARDPMKELKTACDAKGIPLGFYYSHSWDWHEPDALGLDNTWDFPDRAKKDFNKYLRGKSLPQVRELLTQYHPAILWFDVPNDLKPEQSRWFLDLIRGLEPDCVVNDRIGNGLGDYGTPEQFIPARRSDALFEVCMTLNNHWGYARNDPNWKEPKVVIHNLVDIVSKGGNYLLNVGPTAEGVFPPEAIGILGEVGRWMKVNSESIYGTDASPLAPLAWGRCTIKPDKLYLHVFDWPADGQLVVPGLKANVIQAYLLADAQRSPLNVKRFSPQDMVIQVPDKPLDPIDTVVVLEYEGSLTADPSLLILPGADNVLSARAATCHGKKAKYVPNRFGMPNDCIGSWTEPADRVSWQFRTIAPGEYEVVATYAADAAHEGNAFTVEVAGTKLEAKVNVTGDNKKFQPFKLGTVNLPGPGTHELVVQPAKLNAKTGLMDLHAITLAPVRK